MVMWTFLQNAFLWTLALYGLFEIIKTLYCYFTYKENDLNGIYFIIAMKNQEEKIEGIIRTLMFKILYGKEEKFNKIILTDLNWSDNTRQILLRLAKDYESVDYIEADDLINLLIDKKWELLYILRW